MGAPMVQMVTSSSAPRLSTMPARQKAMALEIAVRPLSSSAQGWMTSNRS